MCRSTVRDRIPTAISYLVSTGRVSRSARCSWENDVLAFDTHQRCSSLGNQCINERCSGARSPTSHQVSDLHRITSIAIDSLSLSLEKKVIRSKKVKRRKPNVMKPCVTRTHKSIRPTWINAWHKSAIHWSSSRKHRYACYIGRKDLAESSIFHFSAFSQTNSDDPSTIDIRSISRSDWSLSVSFTFDNTSRHLCERICPWRFRSNPSELDDNPRTFRGYSRIRCSRRGSENTVFKRFFSFFLGREHWFSADLGTGREFLWYEWKIKY